MKHLKTIIELETGCCKWPVARSEDGTHLFCGEKQKEASPYCLEHHAKAYEPARRRP